MRVEPVLSQRTAYFIAQSGVPAKSIYIETHTNSILNQCGMKKNITSTAYFIIIYVAVIQSCLFWFLGEKAANGGAIWSGTLPTFFVVHGAFALARLVR